MSFRTFVLALPAVAVSLAASSAFAQEPAPAPAPPAPPPAPMSAPAPAPVAVAEAAAAPLAPSDAFASAGSFALSVNHGFAVNQSDLYMGTNEIQGSYFVAPHLSIGLALGAEYESSSPPAGDSSHTLILHAGPRVGYDVRLADKVSFWPQVGIDVRHIEQTAYSATAGSSGAPSSTTSTDSATAVGLTVVAPILFHPTTGFFVGAGPSFYTDLSNSTSNSAGGASVDQPKVTALGLMATIGGSF